MSSQPSTSPDPFASLRHDMRTPVNHIIGYSEMLIEDAEADGQSNQAADLQKIHAAAQQLLHLINTGLIPGRARYQRTESQVANPTTQFKDPEPSRSLQGSVLAVDDNPENLAVLARRLERQGLRVERAENGRAALGLLHSRTFDLVLLDVMMPEVDGYTVLREMKADPETRNIPVIMISALDEMESVVRCIEAGAEDYLPKPFDPVLLHARVSACLEKKFLRDSEQRYLKALEETQQRLDKELADAAAYVRSILPAPMASPLMVDWKYKPSSELAGDSFGYHWIDDQHFAIYLLDVCGHGVGAALLSVAAINVIRSGALPGVDLLEPGAVLGALNTAFPMERQNNLYFTMWYGVYDTSSRTLAYSSGGHPPALLLCPQGDTWTPRRLTSDGMIIGVMEDVSFETKTCGIPVGSSLYVLCDGCYEILNAAGEVMEYTEFEELMINNEGAKDSLAALEAHVLARHGEGPLDDDFSIIRLQFPS